MINTLQAKTNSLKLDQLILGTLLTYISLHMLDEGIFDFAAWAERYWHIPDYSFGKWLLHNIYFILPLGLGYFFYQRNHRIFLPLGLGISLWGFMNGLSHIIFSLIFLEYSPGLISGLVFIALAIVVYRRAKEKNLLSPRVKKFSILAALLYWGLPMWLFIQVDLLSGI